MALHSFDPEIAKIVGVNAATIYQNIVFWIDKNAANDKHKYDGQFWTYNSIKAFGEQFPYLSAKQIKTALNKLIDQGFIVKGDYNKANFDKTCWYGLAPEGQSIGPQGPMEGTKRANGLAPKGQPIPDSKPDIKPDSNGAREKDLEIEKEFEIALWNEFPKHPNSVKQTALKAYKRLTKAERVRCIQGVGLFADRFEAEQTKEPMAERLRYVCHLSTFINQRRFDDEIAKKHEEPA